MSSRERHLFIFEGSKTEPKYAAMLERNFMGERVAVKTAFEAEIYQLYKLLKADDFALDIVNLLKERNPENARRLEGFTRDSFAYVYLFFDYDAHSSLADDAKISELLSFFNNETEHGMLYLSYPMVEAIRHYRDLAHFKDLTVKCKRANCPFLNHCDRARECLKEPHYKTVVATECRKQLNNINGFTRTVWQELIGAHVSKMNFLVNDRFELPRHIVSQLTIFNKQLEKHISHKCPSVAVLSAFPLYALDYYGAEKLAQRLQPAQG